jgi:hypothetical protein
MLIISKGGEFMDRRSWKVLAVFVLLSFLLSGCYYYGAQKEMANAEKAFSDLKGAGGANLVPYEYCSAEKFLEGAKIEFSENDFRPATELANRSKSAAEAGLAEIKKKK